MSDKITNKFKKNNILKKMKKFKLILKIFFVTSGFLSFVIILISSLLNIYSEREKIKFRLENHDHGPRFSVNPSKMTKKQIPKYNLNDLKINKDADNIGQWSAPIDWNVTAIHSILLPDYSVMTYGTFGIEVKEKTGVRKNKIITLTDGRSIKRDDGSHQWFRHSVNSGVDFDIWDFKKGFGDDSHILFKKPVVMDAFCAVVRVIDNERVFIIGGNKNVEANLLDTQAATMIYNIKEKKFTRNQNLNYKRWYASVVRTSDNKLVLIGGTDLVNKNPSITPEILDLNKFENGWRPLYKASSKKLFGETGEKGEEKYEWNYPRSYLSSDGNIVGISYNKVWMMDKDDDFRVSQTNEIELETGGISGIFEDINLNYDHKEYNHKNGHDDTRKLKLLTIGSPVGKSNSTVMIEKDIVFLFGGAQKGDEYAPSNKVIKIDFSDSRKPKIFKAKSMLMPRKDANATILPNGKIFINGGKAYKISIYEGEIYDPFNEKSKLMDKALFRRNYHATSLLLPNGTILVSGGDVWNSEIFYPPYLFAKDWEGNTVLASRPRIENINQSITRGDIKIKLNEAYPIDIDKITIISTGSTTHAQGSEPKFRSLQFSKLNKSEIMVKIPKNKSELQDGTYMIFAISKRGTPSEGKIVYLK